MMLGTYVSGRNHGMAAKLLLERIEETSGHLWRGRKRLNLGRSHALWHRRVSSELSLLLFVCCWQMSEIVHHKKY